ncbi:protein of unknown function [Burkholderia multivorans]
MVRRRGLRYDRPLVAAKPGPGRRRLRARRNRAGAGAADRRDRWLSHPTTIDRPLSSRRGSYVTRRYGDRIAFLPATSRDHQRCRA